MLPDAVRLTVTVGRIAGSQRTGASLANHTTVIVLTVSAAENDLARRVWSRQPAG